MTADPEILAHGAPPDEAVCLLLEKKYALPMVQHGKLPGINSSEDALRTLIR